MKERGIEIWYQSELLSYPRSPYFPQHFCTSYRSRTRTGYSTRQTQKRRMVSLTAPARARVIPRLMVLCHRQPDAYRSRTRTGYSSPFLRIPRPGSRKAERFSILNLHFPVSPIVCRLKSSHPDRSSLVHHVNVRTETTYATGA